MTKGRPLQQWTQGPQFMASSWLIFSSFIFSEIIHIAFLQHSTLPCTTTYSLESSLSYRSFVRQALIISIYLLPPYQSFPLSSTSSLPSVQQCNVLYASSFSRYSFSIFWYALSYQICPQALNVSTSTLTSPCHLDHTSCYAICMSHNSSFSSVNGCRHFFIQQDTLSFVWTNPFLWT